MPIGGDGHLLDNLSGIIFYRLRLSLKNSFDLSITNIAFVICFVIADNYPGKRFFMQTMFKVSELPLWKKYAVVIKSCYNLKNLHLFYLMPRQSP